MNRNIHQPLDEEKQASLWVRWKQRLSQAYKYVTRWGRRLPPGVRSILGVLFLVGGVFGFLPILGFWMIPLGISLLSLDFLSLRKRLGRRFGYKRKPFKRRQLPEAAAEERLSISKRSV